MTRSTLGSLDYLLTGGVDADGASIDIAVSGDRIVAAGPETAARLAGEGASAAETLDLGGRLVSPPLVDAHFHLDSALLLAPPGAPEVAGLAAAPRLDGAPPQNRTGTLLEGISLWGRLKPQLDADAIYARASAYCRIAARHGLLAIRSHVDVSDPRFSGVDALIRLRKDVAPWMDLQLVAFPQDGWFRDANGAAQTARALDRGVDAVGGIPHHERTPELGRDSVAAACRLATERGLRLDLHCDETDDPASSHVETLAAEVLRFGLQGRAAASHVTALGGRPGPARRKAAALISEAELAVIANPLINITLQGRYDDYPKRRGLAPLAELIEAGVQVACGQDCVMDPWYAFGTGDPLDAAHMAVHAAHLTHPEGVAAAFASVTSTPAEVLGLAGYGLTPGSAASLVVHDAASPFEAIRRRAPRYLVLSKGRLLVAPNRGSGPRPPAQLGP